MSVHAYEYTKKQKQGWADKKARENARRDELRNAWDESKKKRIEEQITAERKCQEEKIFVEKMSLDEDFQNDSDIEQTARKCSSAKSFWESLPTKKKENIQLAERVVRCGAIHPKNLSPSLQKSTSIFSAYTSHYLDRNSAESPEEMFRDFSFAKKDEEDSDQFRKGLVKSVLSKESIFRSNSKHFEAYLKVLSPEERKQFQKLAMEILPINQAIALVGDEVLKDREWVVRFFSGKGDIKKQTDTNIALTYQKLPQEIQDDPEVAKAALKGKLSRVFEVFPVLSAKQKDDKDIALFALKNNEYLKQREKIEKIWPNLSQKLQLDDEILDHVVHDSYRTREERTLQCVCCVFTCGVAECVRMCIDAMTKRDLRNQVRENQETLNQTEGDELNRPLTASVKTAEMT